VGRLPDHWHFAGRVSPWPSPYLADDRPRKGVALRSGLHLESDSRQRRPLTNGEENKESERGPGQQERDRGGLYHRQVQGCEVQRREVIAMFKAGKRVSEIAAACGYPKNTGHNRTRRVLVAAGLYKEAR